MKNDILPSKKIGMMSALFAGDSRSLRLRENISECRCFPPDIVITDLIQLCDHMYQTF